MAELSATDNQKRAKGPTLNLAETNEAGAARNKSSSGKIREPQRDFDD
jgi:hypothetical protein